MRHYAQLALATTLLLTTVACAQPAATPTVPATVAAPAVVSHAKANASRQIVAAALASAKQPVIKDLGHADGAAIAVSIASPKGARKVQALQHRWIAADIETYQAVLKTTDANGEYTETVSTLDIPAKAYNTSTTSPAALVAFTGLEANKQYKVVVTAWGSNDSTSATETYQQMNTQVESEAFFDYIEDGNADIETTPPAQDVTIVLDSYEFNGAATVNAQVTDGEFENVPGPITAEVVVPTEGVTFLGLTPEGDSRFKFVVNIPAGTTLSKVQVNTYAHRFGWLVYNNTGFEPAGASYAQNLLTSITVKGETLTNEEFQTPGALSGFVTFDVVVPQTNVERNFGFYLLNDNGGTVDMYESNFITN